MNVLILSTVFRASATSVLRLAVVLAELGEDGRDRRPPAGRVVRRQRLAGEELRPELPGDDVHLALDAVGLGLGELQHLVGGQARRRVPVPASRRTSPCRAASRRSTAAAAPSRGTVWYSLSAVDGRPARRRRAARCRASRRRTRRCPSRRSAIAPRFRLMAISVSTFGGFFRLAFAAATTFGM